MEAEFWKTVKWENVVNLPVKAVVKLGTFIVVLAEDLSLISFKIVEFDAVLKI